MKTLALIMAAMICVGANAITLPVKGHVVKPSDPMIQYVGRVSLKNPSIARFNYPGTHQEGFRGNVGNCSPEWEAYSQVDVYHRGIVSPTRVSRLRIG